METTNKIIYVKDYSQNPGPRYCNQGKSSGEDFYHKILNVEFADAYNNNHKLIVNLDGVNGYASSFLDEAFGNLVYDFGEKTVARILQIESEDEPEWINMIKDDTFKEWERRRINNEPPRYTASHRSIKRLVNDCLITVQQKS